MLAPVNVRLHSESHHVGDPDNCWFIPYVFDSADQAPLAASAPDLTVDHPRRLTHVHSVSLLDGSDQNDEVGYLQMHPRAIALANVAVQKRRAIRSWSSSGCAHTSHASTAVALTTSGSEVLIESSKTALASVDVIVHLIAGTMAGTKNAEGEADGWPTCEGARCLPRYSAVGDVCVG